MTQNDEIFEILSEKGAVIQNSHLIYTSGKHGSAYVNKDAIYPDTRLVSQLCKMLAEAFVAKRTESAVEVVVAPVLGGIILSQWVAHHLTEITGKTVLSVYAEKDAEGFVLKRGYDKLVKGKRVLIVEDVLNTGGSVIKVLEATRKLGAEIVGVAALCNRGGVTAESLGNVPRLYSLMNINLEAWEASSCPLCSKGIPINTEVGKGKNTA